MIPKDLIDGAADLLAGVDRVAVLTDAGISAESGVPTFRGEDGLWRRFRAEELATRDFLSGCACSQARYRRYAPSQPSCGSR